jgi:SAM-dependent methyltransferase
MNEKELKEIVLSRGPYGKGENLRIYGKFFENWLVKHAYIYKKFKIDESYRILDIGCGPGHNLVHFNSKSLGIEINGYLVDFGKSLGLNILKINAEDNWPEINGKFDLIWCTDFLIHLVSPFKFLFKIKKYLKEDGKIVIQIPQPSIFRTHISPEHFYVFDKRSLVYLLKAAGYKTTGHSGYIRKLPNWLNAILEPLLQRYGANIWILAEEDKPLVITDKSFLPSWF